jgi:GTP-binding protein
VVVRVPPGTIVQEEIITTNSNGNNNFGQQQQQPQAEDEEDDRHYIDCGTITHINPTQIIATGGQGGEGSAAKTLQRGVRRPRSPPQGGQRKRLKLTLKVVADVALVAVPNAGKSTLLSKVTRAKPKIADYPFTTVVPNLGVWVPSDFDAYVDDEEEDGFSLDEQGNPIPSSNSKSLILCDVPGLIAGASEGVGLGHAFLRHVERCHVILHLLDASSKSVLDDYAMINRELLNYGTGKLATMPQVVVVNKVDVEDFDKAQLENRLKEVMPHSRLMWISAKEGEGVDDLMSRVAMFVKKVKEATAAEEKKKVEKLEQQNGN